MDINYYETKCRKCNNTNEFAFGNNPNKTPFENWKELHFWVAEHLNNPSINNCDKCELLTVQDYIAMSKKP